jgi:hypothetical protein
MFKRFGVLIFIILFIVAPVIYFAGPSFIKRKIKTEVFAQTQIEIDYDQILIISGTPIKLQLTNFSAKKKNELNLTIKAIDFEINAQEILGNWNAKNVKSTILIDDVVLNYKHLSLPETTAPGSAESAPIELTDSKDFLRKTLAINDLDFQFKITKFDYNVQIPAGSFRVYGNNTEMKAKGIDNPFDFSFNAFVYSKSDLGPLSNIYVPIGIRSVFSLKDGKANILRSDFNIADIKNNFSGIVVLKTLDFDTTLRTNIAKVESLEFLKKYQSLFPFSDTSGSLSLEVVARGNAHSLPDTHIKGVLNLKSLSTNVNFKTADMSAKGPVILDALAAFTYAHKIPALNSATWKVNLDNCALSYKDLFQKPAAIRLASEGTISYISDLTIEKFNLLFHSLDVSAKGMASYLKSSDLSVTVKPFKLQDFKNFLPNNKDYDISGNVEIDAQIKGFLTQPRYLSVDVRKIHANNFKYYLKYKNDQFTVEGPLSFTFLGNLLFERAQVLKGSITGQSDLSGLNIWQGQHLRKSNKDIFKLNWAVHAQDSRLNIEKLHLNSFMASFNLKGRPPLAKDDIFDLTLDLESMNWKRAKEHIPPNEWLDTIADMSNKGSIRVRGKLDPFEPLASKVSVDSNLETVITRLSMPFNFHLSKSPASTTSQPEPVLSVPGAFIKSEDLLKAVRWNQKVTIQNVSFKNSSSFQNIILNANLFNNQLQLAGEIGSIFNGRMKFTDVIVPLTEEDPKIKFNLASSNLSFSPLIEFVMPEYKDLLVGVANFDVTGVTKMPGTLNFKKDLVATGSFSIPQSEVQTMKVIDEVKQKFAAIKDFGVPSAVPVSNLSAATQSKFEIKNLAIQLTDFRAIARNNDEIALNGNVNFDLNSRIEGVLKLVNIPVRGDFLAANQNGAGHVEIPIRIEGNLKQPKWSFAGNTFDQMTQNFINYQKDKAKVFVDRKVAEAKIQAQAELDKQKKMAEKALEQKKKELENEAKKQLNNLFK